MSRRGSLSGWEKREETRRGVQLLKLGLLPDRKWLTIYMLACIGLGAIKNLHSESKGCLRGEVFSSERWHGGQWFG